jgi:hypothetical protein
MMKVNISNCSLFQCAFLLSVSFGGIMGLFLGVSLLSGVEVVYYVMKICKAIYMHPAIHRGRRQEPITIKFLVPNNKVSEFRTLSLLSPLESHYVY